MYSKIVPFENIVDAVNDETGITNLRNLLPLIRRLVYRCERDIGFGYGLIIKKIPYSISDGTILNGRIRLPEDLIRIEAYGTCDGGLCPGAYKHQGNYLFFCSTIQSFDLVYYTMYADGEGNPCVTENHFDAVVAGVKYYMYQPKLWNNEGNLNYGRELKQYYFDRIGESIGNDVMPSTKEEWARISNKLRMSYRDMLIYDNEKNCYCAVPIGENIETIIPGEDNTNDIVYDWQFDDTTSNIEDTLLIDQEYLDLKSSNNISTYLKGTIIKYTNVGRIVLAVSNVELDAYEIRDNFDSDITSLVFDTYYNTALKIQYYVSKDVYSYGNIYYKFIKK